MWPELACMFLPIHWSVPEQQQRAGNVSELLLSSIFARQLTHSCTLIELLSLNCAFFCQGWCACPFLSNDLCMSSKLFSLNCAFFWLDLCVSLPIHWSVHEQQQRVVNVSETVVDIYNCKATHSLVHFDWTAFFKLCLFLTGACVCPFPSIDLCMSSKKGLWMWVKLLSTSTIARQLTHSCTLIELLFLNVPFSHRSLCACPFWSIDLYMSSSRRWECKWNCCWNL